jgi:putative membrane protein
MTTQDRRTREALVLLAIAVVCVVVSGIRPYSRLTWIMEVFPVLIGVAILMPTYRRFPLTVLLYRLLLVHALILIVGGYYTYARVPIGFWIQDLFHLSRNHYDRLGHLAQGFVPAILARELLIRKSPLEKGKWLFVIVTSICLAFSAFYELFEWWYAVIAGGESATDFLGSQGDVWDAQWDMFLALIGAVSAQLMLARLHDRALARLDGD